MAVVSVFSLIFNGCCVDGDTSSLLLGRLVNIGVVLELGTAFIGEMLGDSCSERSLSMIDMSDCSYIQMRLVTDIFSEAS